MTTSEYDSREDTLKHIEFVRKYLDEASCNLTIRAVNHDQSSLSEPEKSFYDKYRPLLSSLEYNSPEYLAALAEFRPAIQHHYEHNSHHPEHHDYWLCLGACGKKFKPSEVDRFCPDCGCSLHHETPGIDGMSLFDVLEMLVDWKAAIDRKGTDEPVLGNFEATCKRFSISPQLAAIIRNTVKEFGWPC